MSPVLTSLAGAETLYSISTTLPEAATTLSASALISSCTLSPAFVGRFASCMKASSDASLGSLMEDSIISGITEGTWMAVILSPGCAMAIALFMACLLPLMSLMLTPTTILQARIILVAIIAVSSTVMAPHKD